MNRKRSRSWISSPMYGYIRSRQLELTTELGPKRGVYLLTALRVAAGWGVVSEGKWPDDGTSWPPVFPFAACKLDAIASFSRLIGYHAVRNLREGKAVIASGSPFLLTVPLTSAWTSKGGIIEMPQSSGGDLTGELHAILVVGYDDASQLLVIRNSWGAAWGDCGYGYLPYLYMTLHSVEAYANVCGPDDRPNVSPGKFVAVRRDFWDASGSYRVMLSLYGSDGRKPGWCYAVVRDERVEIEDFFIKPGEEITVYEMILLELRRLILEVGLRPRVWISHCDAATTYNSPTIDALIRDLGIRSRPTLARWAHRVAD